MGNLLDLTAPGPLSIPTLTVNLLLSILLASTVAWFYAQYGRSLSNRARFAQTLPTLALTTVLVISVIKSSLALSLGLVGALSIVRFRTAIKEPEELIYLFMAIGIGVGIGADQRLPTIVAVLVSLGYLFVRKLVTRQPLKNNLYLSVQGPASDCSLAKINQLVLEHVRSADLRRLDRDASTLQATYLIASLNDDRLISLTDDIAAQIPECQFSFVEQDGALGG